MAKMTKELKGRLIFEVGWTDSRVITVGETKWRLSYGWHDPSVGRESTDLLVKVQNMNKSTIMAKTTLYLQGGPLALSSDSDFVEHTTDFTSVHVLKHACQSLSALKNAKLLCEIVIQEEQFDKIQLYTCGQDIAKTFMDKEFSDIKVKCGEKTFDCHRLILAASSRVFKAMLQSEMTEKNENMVVIEDFDSEVIFQVLQCIYSGSIDFEAFDDQVYMVMEILKAADKYELETLKSVCEKKLSSLLDEKNCLKLYILADFHLTPKLEKEALDVVADNLEAVFESEDWEDCIKNHPNLALKISRVAVKGTERKRRKNI